MIELEILQYNYWEHYKRAKDLSLTLGGTHPKTQKMFDTANDMLPRIHELTKLNG